MHLHSQVIEYSALNCCILFILWIYQILHDIRCLVDVLQFSYYFTYRDEYLCVHLAAFQVISIRQMSRSFLKYS